MYLSAKRYVSKLDYGRDQERKTLEGYEKLAEMFPDLNKAPENIYGFYVSKVVGYWRKANQIHEWFVQNAQGGEDDCRSYNVSREQLETLKKLCEDVLKARTSDAAEAFLPTASGFFFGSQEYDDYYWEDLEHTVKILAAILSLPEVWDFSYQASW
jgi:hypothetical protein